MKLSEMMAKARLSDLGIYGRVSGNLTTDSLTASLLLPHAGACFGQTRISVGKASKKLTYMDQVLRLVYEDGSPCPSKSGLSYKSVISFVCRPEAGPTNRPMLISLDKQTCTLFFSWHTPLACEQVVSRESRTEGPASPSCCHSLAPSRCQGLVHFRPPSGVVTGSPVLRSLRLPVPVRFTTGAWETVL